MQTKNIIQTVANVIKITSLKKGDVVKLIESNYSSPESYFAVVLDLLNDGENTFIELLKYKNNFGYVNAEIKLYKGGDNVSLFPTDISELQEHFDGSIKSIEKDIENKKDELQKKIDGLAKVKEFVSGELQKKLTMVDYKEITQEQFNQIKQEKEVKIKELMEVE